MPYPLLMSVACAALIAAAPLPAQAVPDAQFEPAFQVFMRASQGEEAAIAQAAVNNGITKIRRLRANTFANPHRSGAFGYYQV